MGFIFETLVLEVGTITACFLAVVYAYFKMSFNYWKKRNVPYVKPTFPFGNFTDAVLFRKAIGHVYKEHYKKLDGMRFGLMQTKVGLVSLLSKYQFSVSKKTPIPLVFDARTFIITALGGMWLQIRKRLDSVAEISLQKTFGALLSYFFHTVCFLYTTSINLSYEIGFDRLRRWVFRQINITAHATKQLSLVRLKSLICWCVVMKQIPFVRMLKRNSTSYNIS
ncbi:hypothetical protein Cfor_07813, partial [Coptotermes formosanus]